MKEGGILARRRLSPKGRWHVLCDLCLWAHRFYSLDLHPVFYSTAFTPQGSVIRFAGST